VAIVLVSQAASAAPDAKLTQAKKLFDDLDVDGAAKVLDQAFAQGGYDQASYIELKGLEGLVQATLGHARQARDAFYQALLLKPDWKLPGDQPPRVRTPYYEAKGLAAENGPTSLEGDATLTAGTVESVSVGTAVMFHLNVDGAGRTERVALDAKGQAQVKVGAKRVTWWAELFTAKDDVLVTLASAGAPREDGEKPVAEVTPPVEVAKPAGGGGGWMRPVGYGLVGAGVVAGGVGALLGAQAEEARAKIRNAETNGSGVVTGLTQREAYALDASARSNATIANVLFGTAVALAGTGVVFIVVNGGGEKPAVTFAPTPAGVVVAGAF